MNQSSNTPFCPKCMDVDGKRVHMLVGKFGAPTCPNCETSVHTEASQQEEAEAMKAIGRRNIPYPW
jgi:hypothetical protein